tara:strand:- start:5599 stop:6654 length:1056 start_codon:yes stop_codon:yes gene_type:complete
MASRTWDRDHFDTYCKTKIHKVANPMLKHQTWMSDLEEEVNDYGRRYWRQYHADEEYPRDLSESEAANQVMRTLLHLHEEQMKAIIQAHVDKLQGGDVNTLHTLQEELKEEISTCWNIEAENDHLLLKRLQADSRLQQLMDSILTHLKWDVVLLMWCSEWKNSKYFWCDPKGPGYVLLSQFDLEEAINRAQSLTNETMHAMIVMAWNEPLAVVLPEPQKEYIARQLQQYNEHQLDWIKRHYPKGGGYREEDKPPQSTSNPFVLSSALVTGMPRGSIRARNKGNQGRQSSGPTYNGFKKERGSGQPNQKKKKRRNGQTAYKNCDTTPSTSEGEMDEREEQALEDMRRIDSTY